MGSVIDKKHDKVVSKQNPHKDYKEFKPNPPPPEGSNVSLNDFLNPRSMLTPGVAGSLVMLIANTLWVHFSIPQKWSALILSFLLIIPVLIRFSASIFESIIYFIFNGLIVFALAVNANFLGIKLQEVSGVVEHASLNVQQINTNLKSSLVAGNSGADQKIKNMNQIHLASNDNQSTSLLSLASDNQKNTQTDSSTQTVNKKDEKNKTEENKENKKFFQKWF